MRGKRVAVVGAGAAGLSAALALREGGAEPVVFEAAEKPGGKIGTVPEGGFLAEDGPTALVAGASTAHGLAAKLGLAPEIRDARARAARYVFTRGRLHAAPSLGLFSAGGWTRAALEPFWPGRPGPDGSLHDYLVSRLGRQAGALAAGVMARGVYAGDPERLSAQEAFPSLGAISRDHRSLLLGALAAGRASRGKPKPRPGLWSFAGGLSALVRAMAGRLGERLRLATPVVSLAPEGAGFRVGWDGAAPGEGSFESVILALPAFAAANLCRGFAPGLAGALGAIPYAPVAVVHLGVKDSQLARPAAGFGLIDGDGTLGMLGALFPGWLFPGRAPEGCALLTAMVGGVRRPQVVDASDAGLVELARAALGRALGLAGDPVFTRVVRHARAIPQIEVGHAARVKAVEKEAARFPSLALCGAAYHGVSVDSALIDGGVTAARLLKG